MFLFVAATLLVASSLPSAAQISIDMNKITCGGWLGYSPEERDFVRFWLSGYYNSAANSKILNYDRFQRNSAKVAGYCKSPQVPNPADGDQEPWLVAVRDGLHPDKQWKGRAISAGGPESRLLRDSKTSGVGRAKRTLRARLEWAMDLQAASPNQHAMVDLSRLLFSGALLLTACTAATSPSLYRVTELVPGISTRDDAIAKLGPPSSTSNIGNSTILQWGGNNSPVHLAISFGMDGRMIQAATDAQKLDQLSGATQ